MGKSIADNWVLSNEHFDKDVLMAAIMIKGGTFEPLYTDPLYFRDMSTFWWLKWSRPFNDWFDALDLTYNPLEDYEKNDIIHEDTTDIGAEGTTSTSTEVVDQNDTSNLSSATHDKVDRDTTDSETNYGTEITDEDVTSSNSGTSTEITDDDSTSKKTGSDTNAVVGTKNNSQTTNTVEQLSGKDQVDHSYDKDVTTENKVSAFDSNLYQPHDTSHTDDTLNREDTDTTYGKTTTTNTNTSGTDTDDTTTTTTYNNTVTGTDDKTVSNTYSESGTNSNDSTVTTSGSKTGSGTEDITKDQAYSESGSKTKDVTTTLNGSVDNNKTNDRDFDRTLRSTGLVGFLHTRQGLLKEQLDIRAWNAYEHIADIFVKEMTIRVY